MGATAVEVTVTGDELEEAEYAAIRAWADAARMRHSVARQERKRRRAVRRRLAGRLIIATLVVVLGVLAWYRFGADPMASVQR